MTIRVFHDGGPWPVDHELVIDGEELHYLQHVRRARAGAPLEVLDGRGAAARAVLLTTSARAATVRIVETIVAVDDGPVLWLGVPDATACLAAITAACELGCSAIVLVHCARSPRELPGPARIGRVIRAALRQCGMPRPPDIVGPTPLADLLAAGAPPRGVFAWERHAMPSVPPPAGTPALLLVGPEGGFTDEEAASCTAAGLHPISLGPWTLRTPTAVAAGLARLHEWIATGHATRVRPDVAGQGS